jgi:site-specific DNA recombinase
VPRIVLDLDVASLSYKGRLPAPLAARLAMGRMLVQMLGMFAQFERDTIIDRVIAGMERKAAAGKWKGGRRPFCYQVDPATSTLIPCQHEAAVVRLTRPLSCASSSRCTRGTGSAPAASPAL